MNSGSLIFEIFFWIERTAPVWAPILLVVMSWRLWVWYVNELFFLGLNWKILEIKVPQEVARSPQAMEMILTNAFYQTGGYGNWVQKYWSGNKPLWFSLEIVSIEGGIHFFIRTPEKFARLIETQVYAQYPNAEVFEVEDYTMELPDYSPDGDYEISGGEWKLEKADPYPIKTYIDYGLDKALGSLDEDQKIDPLTPMIEWMGSLGKGEQVWFQILIRPSNWIKYQIEEEDKDKGKKVKKMVKWNDLVKKEISEYKKKFEPKEGSYVSPRMTKMEESILNALERSASKLGFDVGVRHIYIAVKDSFNKNTSGEFANVLRQYNSLEFNSFKSDGGTGGPDFVWEDVRGVIPIKKKKKILKSYKSRWWWYPRFDYKNFKHYIKYQKERESMVLTTEELATIYHLPSTTIQTPTFKRINSKKVEAPFNLPI